MFYLQQRKSKRGFTLVELLVSMAIFIVLVSVTLVNMRAGETSKTLRYAAQEFTSQLERMRNFSQTGATSGGMVPRGGYGISFAYGSDATVSYTAFADKDPLVNKQMDSGESLGVVYSLPRNMYFSSFTGMASPAHIVFTPPYGDIWINGAQPVGNIELELRAKGKSEIQKIIFNIQNHTIDY